MTRLRFLINPIMVKEFRSRMRGWRAFAILTVYLFFLALFSYALYLVMVASPPYGTPLSPMIGQSLFAAITNLSLFFVAFLMPALTATAISSEKERLTLEMLQATPLSVHAIIIGKLISSASYILLLIFAAVPMMSLIFTFGGVTPGDLVTAMGIILVTALTFGIMGLFFSAWRKHTVQALILSYLTILLMTGGTFAIYIFWAILIEDAPPRYVLLFNPFSALASVLAQGSSMNSPMGLFSLIAGWGRFMNNSIAIIDLRPLWHYSVTFQIGFSLILYFLATRFIKPIRPWKLGWKGVALIILCLALYFGSSTALFYNDVKTEMTLLSLTPTPIPRVIMPVEAEILSNPAPEPTPTLEDVPDGEEEESESETD